MLQHIGADDAVETLPLQLPYKVGRLELKITQLGRDEVQLEANGKQFAVGYGKSDDRKGVSDDEGSEDKS